MRTCERFQPQPLIKKISYYFLSLILFCIGQSLYAQAPLISGFTPAYGCAGATTVTISGTDFVNVVAVNFGGIAAQSFTVDSATQITAIPGWGNTGKIEVITANGSDSSLLVFTVINIPAAPAMVSATPDSICKGMFTDLNAVSNGNLINWYTTPSGGNLIGTTNSGINFLVNPAVTTTYWAEAETPGPADTIFFNYTGAIVNYTVPPDVYKIRINAKGAQGGAGGTALAGSGGLGANMSGLFAVTPGQQIKILVGQQGGGHTNTAGAGGGGGSFVTDAFNNPLIIAGGGGGVLDSVVAVGKDAVITNNGQNGYSTQAGYPTLHGIGGINGNGATNNGACGGNGAGLLTNGGNNNGCCNNRFGYSFLNLGAGGSSCTANADYGGYGGGGGGGNHGAGGGGGYSGGGGAYHTPVNGGGGASFNLGFSQVNIVDHTGNGQVSITPYPQGCLSSNRTPVTVVVNTDIYPHAVTGTGSISANPVGGLPPYQYSVDAGAFTANANFNNLCEGSHTLTVIDHFANGCLHDTTVNIQNPLETFAIANACTSFAFNGNILTNSGLYTDTLISAFGCDSIVHLDLTVVPVNVAVAQSGNTLSAVAAGAAYQWLDCDAQLVIPGENAQSFSTIIVGSFAAIITQNGCTDTSDCFLLNATSIPQQDRMPALSIYPNPARNAVLIERAVWFEDIHLYDLQMREVYACRIAPTKSARLPIEHFANGLYFVRVGNSAVQKLLIQH